MPSGTSCVLVLVQQSTAANPGEARNERIQTSSDVHALSAEPSTTNRYQREGQYWLRPSRLIAVTGRAAVHRSQPTSACFGQHCLTPRPILERFLNQLPNPSVEGTSTIRLRLLAAAPHLKR